MADQANPFEAFQAMMLQNLEKVQSATQSYIDTVEKAMLGFPGAKEDQIADFKAFLERKVAANRDFVEKLLRAKDFQEAIRFESRILSVLIEGRRRRRKPNRRQNGERIQPLKKLSGGRSKHWMKVKDRKHPAMDRVNCI